MHLIRVVLHRRELVHFHHVTVREKQDKPARLECPVSLVRNRGATDSPKQCQETDDLIVTKNEICFVAVCAGISGPPIPTLKLLVSLISLEK